MYGLTPEQVKPGTTVRQVFEYRLANGHYHVSDREDFVDSWAGSFGETSSRIQELADGRIISVLRRRTASGGRIITHEDITERQKLNARLEEQNRLLKQQEERLTAQNLQLDAALENMLQGLAMYDADHRLVVCNKSYAEMYGLAPEQVKAGTPLREIIEHRIAKGEFAGNSAAALIEDMAKRVAEHRVVHYTSELSGGRYIAVSVQPTPDGGMVTTHHDITEQRRSEAKIAHMALHDTLTGLPNRVLLNERLEDALRRVKRGEIVAMHLLDLDHFKTVNDSLGHPAGDKLLRTVADRLRALVRETDTIARMGGDEFAIVQSAIAQPADATSLAHRAIEAVSAPYQIEGHQVVIGTSVGIAVGPSDGANPEQLIRNADLALYRAKGDGRSTYRFFEPEMDAQMQVRRSLEDDLRKALSGSQFELHYQPVVNLAKNDVSGFEALIRWRHPEKGLVSPGTFIPLAEEIGFIVALGEWAIREACAAASKWPAGLRVAVNLSPVQFRSPGLVHVVVGALAASGLAPDRLELEITENTLLQDSEATLSTLYQLRGLGVRIAMDDFGTGYSSLSYLQSFPFDKIKIDRSFVKDIADGVGSLNIVRAVAAMANGLGMETTAEGVETPEQLETVKAEGCTEMQGFVFSRPLPAEQVEGFLRQHGIGTGRSAASDKAVGAG
jgi:diguanylate cyclase (GGDEF)-like protein